MEIPIKIPKLSSENSTTNLLIEKGSKTWTASTMEIFYSSTKRPMKHSPSNDQHQRVATVSEIVTIGTICSIEISQLYNRKVKSSKNYAIIRRFINFVWDSINNGNFPSINKKSEENSAIKLATSKNVH